MALTLESLEGNLFIALQAQILSEVPAIKWIDQDLGQMEWYQERPAVQWPCVLIEFMDKTMTDESNDVQWVNLTIQFRLCLNPFASANSVAPDISKENALQFYEVENQLYQALQKFDAGGIIQPMTRIRTGTELRKDDPYRVRIMHFTTATEDNGAQLATHIVNAKLDIDAGFVGED